MKHIVNIFVFFKKTVKCIKLIITYFRKYLQEKILYFISINH